MELHEALCRFRIPFDDKHGGGTSGVKAVSPAGGPVDRKGALMIAAMNMAVGAHILATLDGITELRLPGDVDAPALTSVDREHVRAPIP
jgi:hypothetical protein